MYTDDPHKKEKFMKNPLAWLCKGKKPFSFALCNKKTPFEKEGADTGKAFFRLNPDSFGRYIFSLSETTTDPPVACPGDLVLYGLYLAPDPSQCRWIQNIGTKRKAEAPENCYPYNGAHYSFVFDGKMEPESGSKISNVTIDFEKGFITLPLPYAAKPLILKYTFENDIHSLVLQNDYVYLYCGEKALLIPRGSVFEKR